MLAVGGALVVAGPPAVGKSTLMRSVRTARATAVLPLELRDIRDWECSGLTGLRDLGRRHNGRVESLALHVDLSQLTMPRGHRLQRLRTLLGLADEVHLLTLWARPEVLLDRLESRQTRLATGPARAPERMRAADRERMKRALLADAASLDRLYESWSAFTADLPVTSSRLVDSSTPAPVVMPATPTGPCEIARGLPGHSRPATT